MIACLLSRCSCIPVVFAPVILEFVLPSKRGTRQVPDYDILCIFRKYLH